MYSHRVKGNKGYDAKKPDVNQEMTSHDQVKLKLFNYKKERANDQLMIS
ncbi:hypothetical protein GCM10028895_19620 [Pontibacter rugosus]